VNIQKTTTEASQTEKLGEMIGSALKGGEVIELISDLGGGKTTFTRGLARGFGSTDRVASPTFTISKVYKNGSKELHHFDFYRLQESGLIGFELEDVLNDPQCSVVVEWAAVVQNVLPKERLSVTFKTTDTNERSLSFECPDKLAYLVKELS